MAKEKKVNKLPKGSEAVASFCGLVLNRVQEKASEEIEGSQAVVRLKDLAEIFGEALDQYSGGPKDHSKAVE
jgi:hypothetical protein